MLGSYENQAEKAAPPDWGHNCAIFGAWSRGRGEYRVITDIVTPPTEYHNLEQSAPRPAAPLQARQGREVTESSRPTEEYIEIISYEDKRWISCTWEFCSLLTRSVWEGSAIIYVPQPPWHQTKWCFLWNTTCLMWVLHICVRLRLSNGQNFPWIDP